MPRLESIKRVSKRDLKGSAVVDALRNLHHSGDQSFEELIARLLSKVAGERIRRAKAGSQGGVDAIADIPFAIETKRYATQPKSRDLVGGLTEAAGTYPDLQLWVLVATCAVAAQPREALIGAGARQGVAVLILDATSPDLPLPQVGDLAALAATDVDLVLSVLADPAWRSRGRKPDLHRIRKELTDIRRQPAFSAWEARLRNDLRELPTWRYLVRAQNERLLSLIHGDAANAFGTTYDSTRAVQRSTEADLTAWWKSRTIGGSREIAVVTGDRYDGKTWLVFRWLSSNLREFSVPVFFFSSDKVKSTHGDIDRLIREEARRTLPGFNTDIIIDRQKSLTERANPWCLVILDGANEYVADPAARAEAVLHAHPPLANDTVPEDVPRGSQLRPSPPREKLKRSPSLLVTCRTRDFDEDHLWLGSRPVHRVELGAYDDREFADALARYSLDPSQLEGMPASALQMVRRPRYLDIAVSHWNELKSFGHITADVLHYLDATDKAIPGRSGAARFDPGPFKEFLANLAAAWTNERRLNHSKLLAEVRAVTHQVDTALHALKSEGVIEYHVDGRPVPDLERLALGMGLFIRDKLVSVRDAELTGTVSDILEPHRDDDEKVRWLRAAVTVSLLSGDGERYPNVSQALISAWLSSRNFSQADLDDLRNLAPLLIEPALGVLNSPAAANANVVLLAEPLVRAAIPYHETAVAAAVRRWFRMVPIGSQWFIGDESREPASIVAAASESSFGDLTLEMVTDADDNGVRKLQRLGLSIASTRRSLVRPIDVLALMAGRHAVGGYLDQGEVFAIRQILWEWDVSWFEQEVQSWAAGPKVARLGLLRDLIDYIGRNDLQYLLRRLPPSPYSGWSGRSLTRADLLVLKPGDTKKIMADAARTYDLALDPDGPAPPRAWRRAFAKAVTQRFGKSGRLHDSRISSRDDFDLEQIESALAAWAPDAGDRVIRHFLSDIPRRIRAGEVTWSWISGHAALLTLADRRQLLSLIRKASPKNPDFTHALLQGYLCVMAGSPSSARLRLLLEHPFEVEWLDLYKVAATRDDALCRKTNAVTRVEQEPRRLKRSRYLLGYFRPKLTLKDLGRLIADVSPNQSGGEVEDAARFLLTNSRMATSTPAKAFGPLVHIARSLSEAAWQYEAFLGTTRRPGLYPPDWLAKARSAPHTARHNGADATLPDADAVAQGIGVLAARVQEQLAQSQQLPGRWEQFPDGFADEIGKSTFDAWVDLLRSAPSHSRRFALGLLMPVVRHALRTRHPAAKELWAMAYPFQRGRFSPGRRYVNHGLDWTLSEIHDPKLDERLAKEILRELVADCRTNSELVQVAMGARVESTARLVFVVDEGLGSNDETDRARARFIAGWLPENCVSRRKLAAADRSRWVENVGRRAIQRLERERWAREWLRRFLYESQRARRWAAGRLFLACTDAATPFWVHEMLHKESGAPALRRAEAQLLVQRVLKKTDDSALRDNFLGYPVRELSAVVSPWRAVLDWSDIRAMPTE